MARVVNVCAKLLAVAALWCAGPATAETLRVGKSAPAVFTYSLLEVGMQAGIFKKHGLDIESSGFGGGPRLQQAMAADSIDIGLGTGPDRVMIAKGSPTRVVGALAGRPIEMVVLAKPSGPIQTAADLKGKKVAVTAAASLTGWLMRELSRKEGWGPEGVVLVSSPQTSASRALMKVGEIDAMVSDLAFGVQSEQAGEARILVNFGDLVPDFHIQVFFATEKLIATRPETVRAFLAGWYETIAYVRTHKDETVKVVHDVLGSDPVVIGKIYDIVTPAYSSDGRLDPRALSVLAKSYVDLKLVDKEPDMSKFIDEQFLPKH